MADEVADARPFGRVEHRRGLAGIERERLLAQHVLAGTRGFDRERGVRRGRVAIVTASTPGNASASASVVAE